MSLSCAGHDIVTDQCGIVQQISNVLSFLWRPMAVKQNKLSKLWCEDVLLPNPVPAADTGVDESLCVEAESARVKMNAAFATAGDLTGEQAAHLMKQNSVYV